MAAFSMQGLALGMDWDKTFPKSEKVEHRKVTFHNRYGLTLAADLYEPKEHGQEPWAAIAVCGPFGAVKEQAAGLYAQTLAERGFLTSPLSLINMPILQWAGEIRSAVLMIHGEKAHSRYFSEDTFKKLRGDNKRLVIILGAVHTGLYDRRDIIPFDTITEFFTDNLK